MKCPNCGKKIDRDDRFCMSCGAALDQEGDMPKPKVNKKKKGGKKWIAVPVVCVLVLAVAGIGAYVFGGSLLGTDDENVTGDETVSDEAIVEETGTVANESNSDMTASGNESGSDDGISEEDSSDDLIILSEAFTDITVTDEDSAILAAEAAAEALGLENALEELETLNTTEAYGDTYYRLQQYYQGYPVYGRAVVVIADENGEVTNLVGNVEDIDEEVTLTAEVTQTELEESLASYAEDELGLSGEVSLDDISDETLVVYNLYDEDIHLAYELGAVIGEDLYTVVMDANDAEVLVVYETISGISADGTNSDGSITVTACCEDDGRYSLFDETRGICILNLNGKKIKKVNNNVNKGTDEYNNYLVFSDSVNEDGKAVFDDTAVTYLYNVSRIYDVFQEYGMTSEEAVLLACYNDGTDFGLNAYGSSISIAVGKVTGVSDIDATAHEFTHFVMKSHIGNLTSDFHQAIEEGFSDIFACIVEYKLSDWDEPDWRVTQDNVKINGADRNIANPKDTGNEEKWNGKSYKYSFKADPGYDYSTIISHSAYLMWTGNNGSGSISVDELAELWYRAMLMFPSDCNFYDVRVLVEAAANNMGLTSEQQTCVSWAFEQVGISQSNISDATVSMGTISGQVMSEPDEIGILNISYATITIADEDGNIIDEVITSEAGSYKIELPVGIYILKVEAEDYESKTVYAFAEENEETELDIQMMPKTRAEELFEEYINDVLIPKYGILETGATTEMSYDEDYKGTWLNRGIMSATIADFDGNGADECMVFILMSDEENGEVGVALSAIIYEIVEGEVTRSDIIYLDRIDDSDWFLHSWNGSLVEANGCLYFIFEYCEWPNTKYALELGMSSSSAVEEAYSVYAFADGDFEKVHSFDRVVNGEEGSVYYEHMYEDDGVTEEALYTTMNNDYVNLDVVTYDTYIEAIEYFASIYGLSVNEDIMIDTGRSWDYWSESIFLDSDNLTRLFAHAILAEGDTSPYVYEQTAAITIQYSQDGDYVYEGNISIPDEAEEYNGHHYCLYEESYTWEEAKEYCESLGGHLITVTTQAEQDLLESMLSTAQRNSYWIGGHMDEDGNWYWITGEEFSYENWASSQPDNYTSSDEDALMVYRNDNPNAGGDDLGTWNDLNSDGTCDDQSFFGLENFGFICEWD